MVGKPDRALLGTRHERTLIAACAARAAAEGVSLALWADRALRAYLASTDAATVADGRVPPTPPPPPATRRGWGRRQLSHPSRASYTAGCHCPGCKAWHREYMRARYMPRAKPGAVTGGGWVCTIPSCPCHTDANPDSTAGA